MGAETDNNSAETRYGQRRHFYSAFMTKVNLVPLVLVLQKRCSECLEQPQSITDTCYAK